MCGLFARFKKVAVATVEKLLLVEIQLYYFTHQQTCYAGRPANFQSKLVLGCAATISRPMQPQA